MCFVGTYPAGGSLVVGGTAFFVWSTEPATNVSGWHVVTARHVIDEIKTHWPGQPVVLVVNSESQATGIDYVLTNPDEWHGHPQDPSIDVAVYEHTLSAGLLELDHVAIGLSAFATDEFLAKYQVGIGDELLFPGLFRFHQGTEKIRPIMRQGTIAAMPHEKIDLGNGRGLAEAYLAEARSIGGLSGSPVLLHMDLLRPTPEPPADGVELEPAPDSMFGVMVGHWDAQAPPTAGSLGAETVNMGIAIVVPGKRVLEKISGPEVSPVPKHDSEMEFERKVSLDFDAAVFTEEGQGTGDLLEKFSKDFKD